MEIVNGLSAGQRIVVEGAGFLSDGDTVMIRESSPTQRSPGPPQSSGKVTPGDATP